MRGFSTPILLILLLIILAGFFIINHPRNSQIISPELQIIQTERTYSNQALGFEFKYDKDLVVREDTEEDFNRRGNGNYRKNFKGYVGYDPGKFVVAIVVLAKDEAYDINPFTVWIFDNPDNLSIDAWYKNYWYYPFIWGDFTYTGKIEQAPKIEATISGQLGKSGIIDYSPGKPKFVYVSRNGKMYLFRMIGSDGDKILGTFKLI